MAARNVGAFGPIRFPVFAPSGCEGSRTEERPVESPTLAHVHGFHAAARPGVLFLEEDRIAFAAGKLVVELDLQSRSQRFVHGHSDAVTCIASSAEQNVGASGQLRCAGAKCAEVLIWSLESMQVVSTLLFHQADVECIGFTHGGEVVVSIGTDRDHTMALWPAARDGPLRLKRRGGAPLLVCSAYKSGGVQGLLPAPGGPILPPQFVTFGQSHVKFWQSDRLNISSLEGRRGAFGSEGPPRVVVTVAWAARDRLIAGGSEGEVYFFEGTRAIRRVQQQHFCVALLVPLRDALLAVYSHGTCSMIRSNRTVDIEVSSLPGAPDSRMQSTIVGGASWGLSRLVLVSRTHLMLLDLLGGTEQLQSCALLATQPCRPITSVCAHPVEPRVFTGALDGGVRCYRSDVQRPLPERSFKAPGSVTCLAVSGCAPGSGSAWLAVGCDDSTLSVVSESSFHYVFKRCLSTRKAKLTCARFSTCDTSGTHPLWLAVGAEDGCIHTFRFKESSCQTTTHSGAETLTRAATLQGHGATAPIVDLSFADTLPSHFLLSVDAAGQALAFDVRMGRRLMSLAQVRDVPFSPWTSPIGWQVLGCWKSQRAADGAVLPARHFCEVVGRSAVAASDAAKPAVELFPFPCPTAPLVPTVRLEGPAVQVSAVLHSACSDSLLAASDTVLFVWGWQRRAPSRVHALDGGSPARPARGGGVVFETPEGRKHAMSPSPSSPQFTPQPRTSQVRSASVGKLTRPGKENVHASPLQQRDSVKGRHIGGMQRRGTPGTSAKSSPARPSSWSPPVRAWEDHASSSGAAAHSPPSPAAPAGRAEPGDEAAVMPPLPGGGHSPPAAEAGAFPEEAAAPVTPTRDRLRGDEPPDQHRAAASAGPSSPEWAVQPPQVQDAPLSAAVERRRGRDLVAPKIGAADNSSFCQVSSNTQRIREDTRARARTIHERQQFDTVGQLLGGPGRQSTLTVDAPQGGYSETSAGKFQLRLRDAGVRYEVEARLPRGRLHRVLRNPLRKTLTFEGEVLSCWARGGAGGGPAMSEYLEERLVVRLPPGFDLAGPPACVERSLPEGRCFVAVHRNGEGPGAGVPERYNEATVGNECEIVG